MHHEVRSDALGRCPKCGMDLVPEQSPAAAPAKSPSQPRKSFLATYRPLFAIVGLIALTAVVSTVSTGGGVREGLAAFMAGFFLVFSGLKLLDVPGFAKGYATYDLLAARVKAYGYVYPFVELALGLSYVSGVAPYWTNVATAVLMAFGGIGVAIKVARGEKFRCACLGMLIDVPLTHVTLVEDFGMAGMALFMILSA